MLNTHMWYIEYHAISLCSLCYRKILFILMWYGHGHNWTLKPLNADHFTLSFMLFVCIAQGKHAFLLLSLTILFICSRSFDVKHYPRLPSRVGGEQRKFETEELKSKMLPEISLFGCSGAGFKHLHWALLATTASNGLNAIELDRSEVITGVSINTVLPHIFVPSWNPGFFSLARHLRNAFCTWMHRCC